MSESKEPEPMEKYEVVIGGGGPVGLWMACELRLKGISVLVAEKKPVRSQESRAGAIHCRTLECLDMRGVLDEVLVDADRGNVVHFAGLTNQIEIVDVDSRQAFSAFVSQRRLEEIFEPRALGLGAEIRLGSEVTGFVDDGAGVTVTIRRDGSGDTYDVRAQYLLGCDGGQSAVRKLAGIELEGMRGDETSFFGDVSLTNPPNEPRATYHNSEGSLIFSKWADGTWRVVRLDSRRLHVSRDEPVTLDELKESVHRASGIDFGIHSPTWLARISNTSVRAAHYRRGRVFLAGDAAHLHPPMGGQGLNLGLQDANNLAWKLSGYLRGEVPAALLDSYGAERMPVADGVIGNCRAQHAISIAPGLEGEAVRDLLNDAIGKHPDFAADLARRTIALNVQYAPTRVPSHALVGRRARDLDLAGGPASRLYELMRPSNFVLLSFVGELPSMDLPGAVDAYAVTLVDPTPDWAGVTCVLVRPDGYIAWATDQTDPDAVVSDLSAELRHWFVLEDAEAGLASVAV